MRDRPADLPVWVNWVAQDKNGAWWGFEAEPNEGHNFWYENEVGRVIELEQGEENPQWRATLRHLKDDGS